MEVEIWNNGRNAPLSSSVPAGLVAVFCVCPPPSNVAASPLPAPYLAVMTAQHEGHLKGCPLLDALIRTKYDTHQGIHIAYTALKCWVLWQAIRKKNQRLYQHIIILARYNLYGSHVRFFSKWGGYAHYAHFHTPPRVRVLEACTGLINPWSPYSDIERCK